MSNSAVSIVDLGFKYPGQSGNFINHLNLEITEGERFGLFGPNGAGKTTLIHCITGLLRYQQGSIRLFGHEVKSNRRTINKLFGFVPQDFSFYQELTPLENLNFFGAWAGMNKQEIKKKSALLLEVLGLSDLRNKQVQKFSGGMKRRVNLAIGVLHDPRILFLDEPTVGVDVHTRKAIISYLKEINKNGTTLIYTSHQLSEAEELCNKIALINDGKILVHDSLDKLLLNHTEENLEGLFIRLTGKTYEDSGVIK
ncbi:MAG TPA: ABC transporter ATP-binding protein [Chitinophagaceae bacterium]|nr:ABC transporter ATP-binding protein [Chitinophagaceae bacterium]